MCALVENITWFLWYGINFQDCMQRENDTLTLELRVLLSTVYAQ